MKYLNLILLSFFFISCSMQSSLENEQVQEDELALQPKRSLPDIIEEQYSSSIGILSYQGVLQSMSNLTGVPITNNRVQVVYNDVKDLLAGTNQLNLYTPSVQQGYMKMAAEFCSEMTKSESLIRNIYPSYSTNNLNIENLVDAFVNKFWAGKANQDTKDSAIEDYSVLLEDFKTQGVRSADLAFSACVGSLAALPVMIY